MTPTPTWREIAAVSPQFMEWIVQKYGPLPEGPADAESIKKYMTDYDKEMHSRRFETREEK